MPDCQLKELAQGNHQDSLKAVVVVVAKLTQSRQRTCCMIYMISFMSGSIRTAVLSLTVVELLPSYNGPSLLRQEQR